MRCQHCIFNHRFLLAKLESFGLCNKVVRWVRSPWREEPSWSSDRCVVGGDKDQEWVPKESEIGPLSILVVCQRPQCDNADFCCVGISYYWSNPSGLRTHFLRKFLWITDFLIFLIISICSQYSEIYTQLWNGFIRFDLFILIFSGLGVSSAARYIFTIFRTLYEQIRELHT